MSVVHKLAIAIYETAREAGPLGAPRGVVYLALQHYGLSYDNYMTLEQMLVEEGLVRLENDCLHAVPT